MFVSGVRLLIFRDPANVDVLDCGADMLKTVDTLLACELADPTALSISPCMDSVSSACVAAVSEERILLSPSDRGGIFSTRLLDKLNIFVSPTARIMGESIL